MVSDIIKTIERAIDRRYHLERNDREWLLDESDKRIEIRVPDRNSIAFSLDRRDENPFAFFGGNPPGGMAKICDAFLFCVYERQGYGFIIEMKSGHKEESEKQMINGRFFCDWLLALCREHGYLNADFSIASLLLWEPREQEMTRALTSSLRFDIEEPDIERRPNTEHFPFRFEVKSRRRVDLRNLISYMDDRQAYTPDNP